MELHGPLGTLFGIAFIALWGYAMYCVNIVVQNCDSPLKWFGTFWPTARLTPEGIKYRRRFYLTVILDFLLFGLAWILLPH